MNNDMLLKSKDFFKSFNEKLCSASDKLIYDLECENIEFSEVERKCKIYADSLVTNLIKEYLEFRDEIISKLRDKSLYRDKGKRKTTIKCLCGNVTFGRRVYKYNDSFVYLLDESLHTKDGIGLYSSGTIKEAIKLAMENSYRVASKEFSSLTGLNISSMSIWNTVQTVGRYLQVEQEDLIEKDIRGELKGKINADKIFCETDGIYVNLQKKDRKRVRFGKAELKVGIAYTGKERVSKGRIKAKNKVVLASFDTTEHFKHNFKAIINNTYKITDKTEKYANTDGAYWTKDIFDGYIWQLDRFHINQAITRNINDKFIRRKIYYYLKNKDIKNLFVFLEKYRDNLSIEKDKEKAQVLYDYFNSNIDGLISKFDTVKFDNINSGEYIPPMGIMEANNWLIVSRRMKNNHSCWSINGANNILAIISKKYSDKLDDVFDLIKPKETPEYIKYDFDNDKFTPGDILEKEGNGYEYPYKGHVPMLDMETIGDRNVIRHIAGYIE